MLLLHSNSIYLEILPIAFHVVEFCQLSVVIKCCQLKIMQQYISNCQPCCSMPREPVVILHVALTDGIASNIQAIVPHPTLSHQSDFKLTQHSEEDTSTFNSAVFYSITSTQPGLKGMQTFSAL